jgi:hypothetical protein
MTTLASPTGTAPNLEIAILILKISKSILKCHISSQIIIPMVECNMFNLPFLSNILTNLLNFLARHGLESFIFLSYHLQ